MHDSEERPVVLAQLVRRVKASAHVGHDAQDHARRNQHSLLDQRAVHGRKRLAVDVLHDEVRDLVLLADVQNLSNVRVFDPRRDPRLVLEHLLEPRVRRELRQDSFDSDEFLEPVLACVTGDPHACHATLRDRAEQLVAIQLEAGRERRWPGRRQAHSSKYRAQASVLRAHLSNAARHDFA